MISMERFQVNDFLPVVPSREDAVFTVVTQTRGRVRNDPAAATQTWHRDHKSITKAPLVLSPKYPPTLNLHRRIIGL